jgi:hypothetical protein
MMGKRGFTLSFILLLTHEDSHCHLLCKKDIFYFKIPNQDTLMH